MENGCNVVAPLVASPGRKISLKHYPTDWTADIKKQDAPGLAMDGISKLCAYQEMLYAQSTYAVLLIFQAMDAAGKDSTIKHVMSGVNPQGCQVFSFKSPSVEERHHGYLWRSFKALPERGRIGIHNRSYYEEVLIARVHPEILAAQQLPDSSKGNGIWRDRYRQINQFERYLVENGTIPIKFYLHVSKSVQKERFLQRIDTADKNWKVSATDVKERSYWDEYMDAYEDVFTHTSTDYAPWYIVPADRKWFTHLAVAEVINRRLDELKLRFPKVTKAHKQELLKTRRMLLSERD